MFKIHCLNKNKLSLKDFVMDKLKSLLKQLGGSEELTNSICEELDQYTQSVKVKYEQEFKNKLQKAKDICLEEINKEKALLAKKVAVYLEAKEGQIQKTAEKHRLNEETEATSTLKRVKTMLEGITIDDQGQNRELQVTRRQLSRLQKAAVALKEERDLAVSKANQANQIALKTLEKNRLLESKVKSAAIVEGKSKPSARKVADKSKTIAEGKKTSKPKRRRLDESRKVTAKAKSTRKTLVENQRPSNSGVKKGDSAIVGIAASIEE